MREEKRMDLSGAPLWLDGRDAKRQNGVRLINFGVGLQWVAVICHGWLLGGFMLLGNPVVTIQMQYPRRGQFGECSLGGEGGAGGQGWVQ